MIDIESSTTVHLQRIDLLYRHGNTEVFIYYTNLNVLLPGMQLIGVELVRTIYEKERTCFITCYIYSYIYLALIVNMK